ncbi:BTE_HP_G0226030.mRNA.1.CDS.1 [Saccharomyces cerevisiae]|nr:BTE_HP_G0226030.mRNA.1.CDS.1 [Saccharomyces cerevisiae]CAI6457870.1 BTE_HP_G0226030.mRNA.1.CDS.1 [Saccharomyces cerevisiae]
MSEEEQRRHATEEEDRDSDFYEHNDDGFVSGDSLDEDQKELHGYNRVLIPKIVHFRIPLQRCQGITMTITPEVN